MKNKPPFCKSTLLLRAAIVASVSGYALTANADEKLVLEEVVVTASKRAENLQDVSVSVSAVGADYMQDAGISDMVDIAQHVPALTVTTNSSPWNTSFRIRRIGHEGNILTFEPDTGLFIDGAFRSRSSLGLGDLVDVERIEVLKGPQSTLYGKNVTAGVIGVTTAAPSQEFQAMAEVSLGEDGYSNVKGYVSGGLTDTVSGRVSLSSSRRDGLIENVSFGRDPDSLDSQSLRGQLLFEPSDDLSIRLIGGAVKRDMTAQSGDVGWGPTMQGVFAALGKPAQDVVAGNRKVEQPRGADRFNQDSYEFTAIVNYDIDDLTLTSITSYDTYDVARDSQNVTVSPLNIIQFVDTSEGYSYSQELRLSSPGGETVDWLTGLFYYHNNFTRGDGTHSDFVLGDDIGNLGSLLFGVPALGLPGDTGDMYNEQDTDTYGIFVSATWNLSDTWSVSGGLRYGYEEKDAEMRSSNNAANTYGANVVSGLAPNGFVYEPSDDWSAVTGNLSSEYHITDDIMVYASYARGFKSGGYNLGFGSDPAEVRPFDEEKVDAYELGWKTHLFEDRLQFNGAMFHTEYNDFQSAAFLGLSFLVTNVDMVTVDGIEFDGIYLINDALTLNYSASYAKAQYDKFEQRPELEGADLPFAPRWKASAGLQYEKPLASGDFYARVDISWVDDSNVDSNLDPRNEQNDYAYGNLKLGWRNDSLDVSVWGKNVTDQDWMNQAAPASVLSALAGDQQAFMNAPRAYGATVRYNF